ncbi:SRPBCC family protein [Bradyrhizobium sp. 1]|uniref:SRPBCC family protein n=1 Tax=Bradyrhizobium sp. 1 TaxID=241591 RepID=UPI001FF9CC6D|nr:SRPBCC family protein [Bradyrhizobium sp. 1]MCK1394451.1 SRPBCC family protein [Bradyrhizobium sp. 1]
MSTPERIFIVRSLLLPTSDVAAWQVIGQFGQPQLWLPGITATDTVRTVNGTYQRRCDTVLGEFHESLIEAGTHWHVYTIDSGPLPVEEYRALIGVKNLAARRSGLLWAVSFKPLVDSTHAQRLVAAVLDAGISRLQTMFNAAPDLKTEWSGWQLPIDKLGIKVPPLP